MMLYQKTSMLIDKKNIHNNRLPSDQSICYWKLKRFASYDNRYDVTILVNGLPLVHIELKRRGLPSREAFNQIIVISGIRSGQDAVF
jgi:type I restriction enzyme R subunit